MTAAGLNLRSAEICTCIGLSVKAGVGLTSSTKMSVCLCRSFKAGGAALSIRFSEDLAMAAKTRIALSIWFAEDLALAAGASIDLTPSVKASIIFKLPSKSIVTMSLPVRTATRATLSLKAGAGLRLFLEASTGTSSSTGVLTTGIALAHPAAKERVAPGAFS